MDKLSTLRILKNIYFLIRNLGEEEDVILKKLKFL